MFKQLSIAALAMMCSLSVMAQTFSISGKVINDFNDEGLPDAVVVMKELNLTTTTDGHGNYHLSGISSGTYVVEVFYVGYQAFSKSVTISDRDIYLPLRLKSSSILKNQVIVQGTRATSDTPMSYTNVSKKEIEKLNTGQDLPYILRFTPSLVSTSDAGTGVGYTGLWIRGSDPSRINITINDIPLNDPESQQVFLVNIPDFASSADGIQIQRGVGTSTNGVASLGGTIKLGTTQMKSKPYIELNNSYGSFNTLKNTVMAGTGLLNEKYTFDLRLSNIMSDGYVDRATARMKSFYTGIGRYGESSVLKLTVFGGNERTYQSWGGVPASRLLNDTDSMMTYAANNGLSEAETEALLNSDRRYNPYTYKNEVDDYTQTHYQLQYAKYFSNKMTLNLAGHYTRGQGYYEQYKPNAKYKNYGLSDVVVGNDTLKTTDLIRRRWLNNHFYGVVASFIYFKENVNITVGGAYNQYIGEHYGEIIWMKNAGDNFIGDRYYHGNSHKDDGNIYAKMIHNIGEKWNIYGDVQLRNVRYITKGIDNDLRAYDVNDNLTFFNPKAGLTWHRTEREKLYASFSVGNKEPNRNDYIDAVAGIVPTSETLYDTELGYRLTGENFEFGINFYNMKYHNQLVLTGDLNDVGAPIRMNVKDSYRRGIELDGGVDYRSILSWNVNLTMSENKIQSFEEAVFSYDVDDYERTHHIQTDIAFSPALVAGSQLRWNFYRSEKGNIDSSKQFSLALLSKYVGEQFLDNTSNKQLTIAPYFVNDVQLICRFPFESNNEINVILSCNNILDTMYSSNGYTYSYVWGSRITETFYFPQAGRNFMASVNLKF